MSIGDWLRGRKSSVGRDGRGFEDQDDDIVERTDPDTGEIIWERAPRRIARPGSAPTASDEPLRGEGNDEVVGERTIPSVNRERSVQSRISNALALGTILLLGGGFLVWYYSTQFSQMREQREAADRAIQTRTAAEMKVPPLGPIDPPRQGPSQPSIVTVSATDVLGPPPPLPPQAVMGASTYPTAQAPHEKTPEELAVERMLNEPVLKRGELVAAMSPGMVGSSPYPAQGPNLAALFGSGMSGSPLDPTPGEPRISPFAGMLQPTPTPAVAAQVVPTRRFLLPKGAFVDCTLETAIDSTYDGMVTCIGASDVYSADGKVVLLERGTKYVGEKRSEARQGQSRVFVLWSEARTPTGVVARLNSPGTDELGRTGLPGHVHTHFWERFGAAILISVIDGALQAAATSSNGGTTVQFNPAGSRDVMTEILRHTVAIPPTIVKNQGERIQVLVARDVDFRPVYALRSAALNR